MGNLWVRKLLRCGAGVNLINFRGVQDSINMANIREARVIFHPPLHSGPVTTPVDFKAILAK